jgi:hypothetical protein
MVKQVTDKLAAGWTATVEGRYLGLRAADGAALGISCRNEEEAQALLDAVIALSGVLHVQALGVYPDIAA